MRVLIVDDSMAVRTILKKILLDLGFEVTEAGNGQEAIDRLKETQGVELVMVDWNMPVMNGYEFIRAVRADKKYEDIRLMMVTTETEIAQVAKALEAGANEYVMKPFTKDIIVQKLNLLGISRS